MPELPAELERQIQDISKAVVRTLRQVTATDKLSGPALYQQVMRSISEIRLLWNDHMVGLSASLTSLEVHDTEDSIFCRELEKSAKVIQHRLSTLSAAGWPRDPGIGVISIRIPVRELLARMLKLLEKERTTLLPLVRQLESDREPKPRAVANPH